VDSIIDFTKVGLTKKQVKYLLFVVEAKENLKDCAKLLGIHENSLSKLLTRVDKKFPGFSERFKKLRKITLDNGNEPREIPWGDMSDLEDLKYGKDDDE
jgi:DNA-binding CsgD family transcriptional regulator